jgi:hypothetical protein
MRAWKTLASSALVAGLLALGAAVPTPAVAQTLNTTTSCPDKDTTAEAATQPNRQAKDGTSPGNIGSTGWTGGTGGAHMGTNPQGALPTSPTWQPPTARGLDLAMAEPKPAASKPGC